jgi:hypothetical protein
MWPLAHFAKSACCRLSATLALHTGQVSPVSTPTSVCSEESQTWHAGPYSQDPHLGLRGPRLLRSLGLRLGEEALQKLRGLAAHLRVGAVRRGQQAEGGSALVVRSRLMRVCVSLSDKSMLMSGHH